MVIIENGSSFGVGEDIVIWSSIMILIVGFSYCSGPLTVSLPRNYLLLGFCLLLDDGLLDDEPDWYPKLCCCSVFFVKENTASNRFFLIYFELEKKDLCWHILWACLLLG